MSNVELDANETIVYIPGVSPEKTLEFYKDYCHNYDKVCYTFSAKRIWENDHQLFLAFRNTWNKNYINDYRGGLSDYFSALKTYILWYLHTFVLCLLYVSYIVNGSGQMWLIST